jgi:hypothetical protein
MRVYGHRVTHVTFSVEQVAAVVWSINKVKRHSVLYDANSLPDEVTQLPRLQQLGCW